MGTIKWPMTHEIKSLTEDECLSLMGASKLLRRRAIAVAIMDCDASDQVKEILTAILRET